MMRGSGPYLFGPVSPWRTNQIKNQTVDAIAAKNDAAANKNNPPIPIPKTVVRIPTIRATTKVPHAAVDIRKYHSCHHPVLLMSCSLRVVSETVGIRNTIHVNQFTTGIRLMRK